MFKMSRLSLLIFVSILYCNCLHPRIEDYCRSVGNKTKTSSVRNIDFIYLINLDERPEKYEMTIQKLAPYGIIPHRFAAVNGWQLPLEVINALGTPYECRMGSGHLGNSYLFEDRGEPSHEQMSIPGKIYFARYMSRGAIGIVLSHLSVLKDAYDSGYETIWVMEDDIEVIRNPHILSDLIVELDALVGKEGWDILFTDRDAKGRNGNYVPCSAYAWRPDLPPLQFDRFRKNYNVSRNFRRVGARYGAYSAIVRRSGMRKILEFFKDRYVFLPFDMEYTLPLEIQLFTVNNDVVSTLPEALSDNSCPNYLRKN